MALAVSNSFMVRTLKAFLLYSQFNCLGSASLSLMVPAETEDRSKRARAAVCIVPSGSFRGFCWFVLF